MKKFFSSLFVVALMVTGSVLSAQEEAVEALAAETVPAAVVPAAVVDASSPEEEVAPVVADAQESVSDGVVLATEVPMASPVASDVILDGGVVAGGGFVGFEQPVQAFTPSSCCQSCCGDSSFVQPVVFDQPIYAQSTISQATPAIQASATSIVQPAPVYSQAITSGCSSCSGGATVNYAPAATSYAAEPVTASYAPTPVATSYAAAPVTSGCSSCGGGATVSYAPEATSYSAAPAPVSSGCSSCAPAPSCNSCQQAGRGLLSRGISSRVRGVVLGRLIRE